MKQFKIFIIFCGFLIIATGLLVIKTGGIYEWGAYASLEKSRFPVGILLIVAGVFTIWYALRKKTKFYTEEKYLKCPQCLTLYNANEFFSLMCPQCSERLEDLEGFYERHPELKEKG